MGAPMDGFYAAYVTGRAGTSIVLFVIRGDSIVGVDVGAMKYDGKLELLPAGGFKCSIVYVIPPGVPLITGAPSPNTPQRIPVEFNLPANFAAGGIVPIVTPLGPVNVRFEKIRDL